MASEAYTHRITSDLTFPDGQPIQPRPRGQSTLGTPPCCTHSQSQGPASSEGLESGDRRQHTTDSNHGLANNGVPDRFASIIDHSITCNVARRGSIVGHVKAVWGCSIFNVHCEQWAGLSFAQFAPLLEHYTPSYRPYGSSPITSKPILVAGCRPQCARHFSFHFGLFRCLYQASHSSPGRDDLSEIHGCEAEAEPKNQDGLLFFPLTEQPQKTRGAIMLYHPPNAPFIWA